MGPILLGRADLRANSDDAAKLAAANDFLVPVIWERVKNDSVIHGIHVPQSRPWLAGVPGVLLGRSALGVAWGKYYLRPMRLDEYMSFDATGLAELVSNGEVTAVELLKLAR